MPNSNYFSEVVDNRELRHWSEQEAIAHYYEPVKSRSIVHIWYILSDV